MGLTVARLRLHSTARHAAPAQNGSSPVEDGGMEPTTYCSTAEDQWPAAFLGFGFFGEAGQTWQVFHQVGRAVTYRDIL